MIERAMHVAGVMSGTSADGVDVALVRIRPRKSANRIRLMAHEQFPYPPSLRRAVLCAMDAQAIEMAALSRLHTRLGMFYADCVATAADRHNRKPQLIGCHGQTVYHQAAAAKFLGANVATTLQIGDPALIAERMRVPVVSDFRPADMAAGGQGAPLVPLLDYEFFRHPTRARVLQNLGGIGNLTLLPPNTKPNHVLAFDTGPGNMVMDALASRLFGKPYDAGGRLAARGKPIEAVVDALLRSPFFSAEPPKSCGREQFGNAFVDKFLARCRKHSQLPHDAMATATLLTARSLREAAERFVLPRLHNAPADYVLSGGGARNATLVAMIRRELEALGFRVTDAEEFGMPAAAKEAIAFALLAWNTWNRLPGNLPSATGASRPVVLGRISHV